MTASTPWDQLPDNASTTPADFTDHWQSLGFTMSPLAGDASMRDYCRLSKADQSWMLSCYPKDCPSFEQFKAVTALLSEHKQPVPAIHHSDPDRSWLWQEDFGDVLLSDTCEGEDDEGRLVCAIDALIAWQKALAPAVGNPLIETYDEAKVQTECQTGMDWFCEQWLDMPLTVNEIEYVREWAYQLVEYSPIETLVHRDYHSRNIMVLDEKRLGIIDYQDAVWGCSVYDWVSLFKDAYQDWSRELETHLIKAVHRQLCDEQVTYLAFDEYWRLYEAWGIQRQFKVLGVFARLFLRDKNDRYLPDMYRVARRCMDTFTEDTSGYFQDMADILIPRLEAQLCKD